MALELRYVFNLVNAPIGNTEVWNNAHPRFR